MKWTESIAVGNMEIAGEAKPKLGARTIGRKILEAVDNGDYELRETQSPYNPLFALEKCSLSLENGFFWDVFLKNQLDNLVRQDHRISLSLRSFRGTPN